MNLLVKDQVAVVTGATAGIGKATALKLAEQGAFVVVIGTNAQRGQAVVEEIKARTGADRATFMAVDIAKTEEVAAAFKAIIEQYKTIDILVNNAGITKDQLFMKMKEQDWDDVLTVNLKSCYNTCHAAIRTMVKARRGRIINISSVVGLIGNPGQANYAASKAGMIGFTKALAKEVASRNILVNCVAPGFIETRMTDEMTDAQKQTISSQIPLEKLGKPEDVANAVLFLASSLSDYITGEVLTVAGGMGI